MNGVRYREGTFEGRCDYCLEYLPLTLDFWNPRGGVRRCKACWREYKRLYQAGIKGRDRDGYNALQRMKRASLSFEEREVLNAKNRAYKAAHRPQIAAYNRVYRERHRELTLERARLYYAECRPVILAKKRQKYAETAA